MIVPLTMERTFEVWKQILNPDEANNRINGYLSALKACDMIDDRECADLISMHITQYPISFIEVPTDKEYLDGMECLHDNCTKCSHYTGNPDDPCDGDLKDGEGV
jgi:hypothetical protein